jgi:arginine deiminase
MYNNQDKNKKEERNYVIRPLPRHLFPSDSFITIYLFIV